MKNKFKTKKFWVSLSGMLIMLLQLFGVKVNAPYVNEVINALCGVCVLVGLMADDKKTQNETSETQIDNTNSEEDDTNEN